MPEKEHVWFQFGKSFDYQPHIGMLLICIPYGLNSHPSLVSLKIASSLFRQLWRVHVRKSSDNPINSWVLAEYDWKNRSHDSPCGSAGISVKKFLRVLTGGNRR